MTSSQSETVAVTEDERLKRIEEAGKRAAKEANERRRKAECHPNDPPIEKGGQKGPDPARFGDWEKDGIASDF